VTGYVYVRLIRHTRPIMLIGARGSTNKE